MGRWSLREAGGELGEVLPGVAVARVEAVRGALGDCEDLGGGIVGVGGGPGAEVGMGT